VGDEVGRFSLEGVGEGKLPVPPRRERGSRSTGRERLGDKAPILLSALHMLRRGGSGDAVGLRSVVRLRRPGVGDGKSPVPPRLFRPTCETSFGCGWAPFGDGCSSLCSLQRGVRSLLSLLVADMLLSVLRRASSKEGGKTTSRLLRRSAACRSRSSASSRLEVECGDLRRSI
jgi:hypothetical protein